MIYVHRINKKFEVGDIITTKNYGNCIIEKILSHDKVKIKFLDTQFTTWCKLKDLKKGHVKDYLKPIVCGIGFLGEDFKNIKNNKSLYKKSYQVWIDMIKRCYDCKRNGYKSYGLKGITVIR